MSSHRQEFENTLLFSNDKFSKSRIKQQIEGVGPWGNNNWDMNRFTQEYKLPMLKNISSNQKKKVRRLQRYSQSVDLSTKDRQQPLQLQNKQIIQTKQQGKVPILQKAENLPLIRVKQYYGDIFKFSKPSKSLLNPYEEFREVKKSFRKNRLRVSPKKDKKNSYSKQLDQLTLSNKSSREELYSNIEKLMKKESLRYQDYEKNTYGNNNQVLGSNLSRRRELDIYR